MPKFLIESSDGAKYEIEAADQQSALAALQQHTSQAPDRSGWLDKADAFVRGAADTVTFGLADKAAAGLGALTGIGGNKGDYEGNLRAQKAINAADERQNPGARIAGQVAGVAVPLLSGNPAAVSALAPVTKYALPEGAGLLARTAANAADAGIYGTIHGFNSNEGDLGDKAAQALQEGGFSALTGAAAPAATGALGFIGAPLVNYVKGVTNPVGRAENYLGRAAMTDLGPDALSVLQSKGAQAAADNVPATLGPLSGENMTKATYNAASTSGPNANTMKDALRVRVEGRPERMAGYIDQNIGPGSRAVAEKAALEEANAKAAEAAYAKAMQSNPPFDMTLAGMLERPELKSALARAQEIHGLRLTAGRTQEPMFAQIQGPNGPMQWPTMEGFQAIKQALDDSVNSAYSAGQSKTGEALKGVRDQLRSRLGALNPDYAAADAQFGAGRNVENAFDLGNGIRGMNYQEVAPAMQAMTPEAQQAMRVGAAGQLNNAAMNNRLSPNALRTPAMRSKLDNLAPTKENAARLQRQAELESAMMREEQKGLFGSRTDENLRSGGDSQNSAGIASALLSQSPVSVGSSLLGAVGRSARGLPGPTLEEVAQMLAVPATDPAFAQVLERIGSGVNKAQRYDATMALIDTLSGRAAGIAGGNAINRGNETRQNK